MTDLGTILGIWAHPDDETYLTAGIMADAARRGNRVVCVTATRGEAGSQDEERWPSASIGEVREAELMDALGILGIEEHHWLDYVDGRCHTVDDTEATAKLAAIIEEVRPDTVLTFDPMGHTGHPDHIAVSRWATAAFKRAAPPDARLYYTVVADEWFAQFGPVLEPFNVYEPGTPRSLPRADIAIDFRLTNDLMELKLKALRAQPSQTEGLIAALGEDFFRQGLLEETLADATTWTD